jgi:hypothetical protein
MIGCRIGCMRRGINSSIAGRNHTGVVSTRKERMMNILISNALTTGTYEVAYTPLQPGVQPGGGRQTPRRLALMLSGPKGVVLNKRVRACRNPAI